MDPLLVLPNLVIAEALAAGAADAALAAPPGEVVALAEAREAARERHDWTTADELRSRIGALGWQVQDTPKGPLVLPRREKP